MTEPAEPGPWHEERWDDLLLHFRSRAEYASSLAIELYELIYVDSDLVFKTHTEKGWTKDVEKAERLLRGYVKWDECANLQLDDGGYWHTCERRQVQALGVALDRVYQRAEDHFGGFG